MKKGNIVRVVCVKDQDRWRKNAGMETVKNRHTIGATGVVSKTEWSYASETVFVQHRNGKLAIYLDGELKVIGTRKKK